MIYLQAGLICTVVAFQIYGTNSLVVSYLVSGERTGMPVPIIFAVKRAA